MSWVVLAGIAGGCAPSALRCPPSFPGLAPHEVLASLDRSGDGTLDPTDLERGESAIVFRLVGRSGQETVVVSRDATSSLLLQVAKGGELPWGSRSRFGTWHELTECSAWGWITHWFFNEDPDELMPSTGAGAFHHLAVDLAEVEHGNIGVEPEVEGLVHLVVEGSRASGFLEGSASTEVISYSTQQPTGQRIEVLWHAFRALPELGATP